MIARQQFLAFDLGAESGRAMAAAFDGRRLSIEEVLRFPNGPVRVPLAGVRPGMPAEAIYWDVLGLWREMKQGGRQFVQRHGVPAGIGVDTWGVDYALLGRDGALLDRKSVV